MNAETIACIINEARDSSDWNGWDTQYTVITWQDTKYRVTLTGNNEDTAVITDERTSRKLATTAW